MLHFWPWKSGPSNSLLLHFLSESKAQGDEKAHLKPFKGRWGQVWQPRPVVCSHGFGKEGTFVKVSHSSCWRAWWVFWRAGLSTPLLQESTPCLQQILLKWRRFSTLPRQIVMFALVKSTIPRSDLWLPQAGYVVSFLVSIYWTIPSFV